MAGFNINNFRSQLTGDGARPNLFNIQIDGLASLGLSYGGAAGQKLSFMAKSAQLPGSTLGMVPLYYFGRELKFAGNRTFTDWTIQVINDEDMIVRRAIEQWMSGIGSHVTNLRTLGAGGVLAQNLGQPTYTLDGIVSQYSKAGSAIKSYRIVGMFPIDIAPIDLDWGSNDTIEEFSVTFAYQWWESDTTDSSASGATGSGQAPVSIGQ